uniref:Uncharacterized protein n=1 Tax=Chromera velia CCMP2878 TaxID=1169474 RepID=A0A0G4I2D2_9ALVE|eukprot:Cvel_10364.t1-p1 / transcript=Cvel_10364.t1 / gene=Cvel_10364 / organism=Chromera_velia_CCMP2878 / gene_product=hypothetical protein / transcript_product=hypothetical protein / location=Cvel_scaffold623:58753-66978(+) / protein_length=876 / sequence_SO=supercontig / SO=protein_coding / is_pseudo=false
MWGDEKSESRQQSERSSAFGGSSWKSYSGPADFVKQKIPFLRQIDIWWQRANLVTKVFVAFGFLQLLVIAFSFLESISFKAAVHYTRIKVAIPELHLADISYGMKMDQIGFGFKGQSRNTAFSTLLGEHYSDATTTSSFSTAKLALQSEITNRKIEYATLLDKHGVIVVNANFDRSGEWWDPAGLISIMRANTAMGQIKTTEILPYADLQREDPPNHRERTNDGDPVPELSAFDTLRDPLVRFIVTPILSSGVLYGILVAGDVVDGKAAIPDRVVNTLGSGYAAVYQSDDAPGNPGPRLVTYFFKENGVPKVDGLRVTESTRLVERLHKVKDRDEVLFGNGYINGKEMVFVGKRVNPRLFENSPPDDVILAAPPKAFVIRGLHVIEILEGMGPATDLFGLVFIFIVTLVPIFRAAKPAKKYLSARSEMFETFSGCKEPLYVNKEDEAERLRKEALKRERDKKKGILPPKQKEAESVNSMSSGFEEEQVYKVQKQNLTRLMGTARNDFIEAIAKWRLPSFREQFFEWIINLLGVFLMVANLVLSLHLLTLNLRESVRTENGIQLITFNIKVNQMAFGFRGMSNNAAVRQLSELTSVTDVQSSSLLSTVRTVLNGEITVRKIEIAMMVKVPELWVMAVATDLDAAVIGTDYTFNDLPTKVADDELQWIITDAIPFSQFKTLGAPIHRDSLANLGYTGFSPDGEIGYSGLIAADTCQEDDAPIVGRMTATPVWASTDTSKSNGVTAVLVSGDMVNGKTALNEWAMEGFKAGFVGVYILQGNNVILLSSLLKSAREASVQELIRNAIAELFAPEEEARRLQNEFRVEDLKIDVDLDDQDELRRLLGLAGKTGGTDEIVTINIETRPYYIGAKQVGGWVPG